MKKELSVVFLGFAAILFVAGCGSAPIVEDLDESLYPEGDSQVLGEQIDSKEDVSEVSYAVSTETSRLEWTGTKVVGTAHNGLVRASSGTILVGEDNTIVSGEVTIDMSTMECIDLEGDGAESLIGHLSGPDFFDIEKFPTSKFALTSVEKNESEDNAYTITGNLTIKDVTKELVTPAIITFSETGLVGDATFSIDRTEWNLVYGSGKFFKGLGDNVIDDSIAFTLHLEATK
ncbi:MAG: YceI family protein [Candidatus Magasanikbacteria bacterium]|nr:YceI family protein [Candidatus Magasanikbacteria bacterium]MBT4221331.1 YceI family protein [Candidatus Magasanikbacteria bacterium]MBT4350821.1 YceI family protein [Candidatus Magasanikbacteria bacterium]MBT4542179.1 YceI family protein [Candidatus Magasanikbacteria bacterium]MBT6253455.1 YceI family protein [Candidatus Magasanikbacteria bacterium]